MADARSSATSTIWNRSFAPRANADRFRHRMKRTPPPTSPAYAGIHVGIIMDGNGRWAAARGMPRTAGHRAGVRTARKIVETATRTGVGIVTLYAFSSDNWTRSATEVGALMRLLRRSLQ